jgi:S-adenosylmethionine decarboxylase
MNTLGRHLLAEFYGCDLRIIDDVAAVTELMREAAARVGATVVAEAFHRYAPQGVSGTLLIAESHLSVHTWPEAGYVAVDIFTCGGLDPRPGFRFLLEALGARTSRMHELVRGLPDDLRATRELLPEDVTLMTRLVGEVSASVSADDV